VACHRFVVCAACHSPGELARGPSCAEDPCWTLQLAGPAGTQSPQLPRRGVAESSLVMHVHVAHCATLHARLWADQLDTQRCHAVQSLRSARAGSHVARAQRTDVDEWIGTAIGLAVVRLAADLLVQLPANLCYL
jgi:hypothetical protein